MNLTPRQCRDAFYQAAANIEERPDLYDFHQICVGELDCPACMWGHVGRVIGSLSDVCNLDVASAFGFERSGDLYDFYGSNHGPLSAATKLRKFADYHWPAESTDPASPDLRECGLSFSELLTHLSKRQEKV